MFLRLRMFCLPEYFSIMLIVVNPIRNLYHNSFATLHKLNYESNSISIVFIFAYSLFIDASQLTHHASQLTHHASQLTHHHINTMTISHSSADDGRKNSSESSCYAYIYCYFYVFTQLYKSLKYYLSTLYMCNVQCTLYNVHRTL